VARGEALSFADPRDGDLEDDTSSTVSRTLLRHAAAILVEVSIPKLLLAFGTLVLLPALLLGAVPILGFWYGRAVVAQFGWGIYALVGVLLAGVGLYVAWRWGRRIFGIAEQNFWSLNSGVVEPLYTALREVLRKIIEALLPTRGYAFARSAAGLAAGGLIGLCAASLAHAFGPLPHFDLPLAGPQDVWPATLAALANGAWAVCAYVMIAAPVWAISEAWAGVPRDLGPADMQAAPRWRIAHLSDIHVVGWPYGFRLECGRDGPRGNARLHKVLDLLAADPPDWILVTGDVTDAGRNEEFLQFENAFAAHPELARRTLVIPGNHDVNIVDRANPARLELPIAPGGALRRLRMLGCMARLQGDRVHVVDRDRGEPGPTLSAWLAQHGRAEALARFMDKGGIRAGQEALAVWEEAFPLVALPAEPDGLGVILFDSNGRTHFSFTNALGILGVGQMRAAEATMRAVPQARWLVAVHHHVVEYPRPGAKLADRIGTALVNGHWVVQRLRRHARRIIVLHGHRHYDWMGCTAGLRVLSAPSPVMAGRDEDETYFWLLGAGAAPDGGLALAPPTRITVPGVAPTASG
jgi:hypothetical protein